MTRPGLPAANPAGLRWDDAMGLAATREELRSFLDLFSMPATPPPCGPGFFVIEYRFGPQLRIAVRSGSTCRLWHEHGRLVRWAPLRACSDIPTAPPPPSARPPWRRSGGRPGRRNR